VLGTDFEVQAVHSRDAFLSTIDSLDADAAVVGLGGSSEESLRGVETALGQRPDLPVMLLSMDGKSVDPSRAGQVRVKAYCDAKEPLDQFVSCLHRVLNGESPISQPSHTRAAQASPSVEERLTTRQIEVLKLIANGHGAKEIASELGISVRTAEFHRAAIMHRLEIRSTAQLTRYALRHGIC
jgi:DNA-binding NarL/FixJ family response regulator